ncbi:MAG: hypothetical protein HZA02_04590 [Nitrospinae bacterium]|nr:hypothetical protein [Nitrospinota bacterium]
MVMLTKRALLLAEIEATYSVDPTPAPATNAILVIDPKIKVAGEVLQREFARSSLSPLAPVIGMKEVEVTFSTELKGSGTANAGGAANVPEIDPLLQGCGLAPTLTAETIGGAGDGHIDYSPISDSLKSVAMYLYLDGLLHKILGAVGNVSAKLEAGKYGLLDWTFKGLYSDPTDAAIASGAVFNSQKPRPFMNASFAIGAYAGIIQALNFELANEIGKRVSANSADGVVGFSITGRGTKGAINPEAVTKATYDFWARWKAGTGQALSATVGDTAGAKIDITAPNCVYTDIGWGDRDRVRTYELPFAMAESSGNDEIKLKFY